MNGSSACRVAASTLAEAPALCVRDAVTATASPETGPAGSTGCNLRRWSFGLGTTVVGVGPGSGPGSGVGFGCGVGVGVGPDCGVSPQEPRRFSA